MTITTSQFIIVRLLSLLVTLVLRLQNYYPTTTTTFIPTIHAFHINIVLPSSTLSSSSFHRRELYLHRPPVLPTTTDRTLSVPTPNSTRRNSRGTAISSNNNNNNNNSQQQVNGERRTKELLSRKGPYFALDRKNGKIEFGATANLVTPLPSVTTISDTNSITDDTSITTISIDDWLLQPNVSRDIVYSIWDPKLVTELDQHLYQLQIMKLQFITITLQPTVNVWMETIISPTESNKPQFIVKSIDFNPNLQLVPGMKFNAQSLGIVIETVGLLQSSSSSSSSSNTNTLMGTITFTTSGVLPLPLRIVPTSVLQTTCNTINTTIMNVVVRNFQQSITKNYQQYVNQKQQYIRQLQTKQE